MNKNRAILIFFGALTGLFFLPTILGLHSFPPGDFTYHFIPSGVFLRNELVAGRLPIWNPYAFSGHPFLADPQSAVFYPLNIIFTLISLPWASPTSRMYWLELEAIFHFLLAGLFTYAFVWDLTKNHLGALLAGTTFVFSGYLTGYPALQLAILRTAIWLPLLMLLLRQAIDEQGVGWWLLFAIIYAITYLAGHPQTFLFLTYLLIFWGAFLLFQRMLHSKEKTRQMGQTLLRAGIAWIIFMGLIAAQLLPGLELLKVSNRATASYEFLSNGAALQDFWQFLLPSPWSVFSHFFVGVIAVGLTGFALVSALFTLTRRIDDPHQHWLAAISFFFTLAAIIALLVGMGRHGPLYALFYRFAPGWNLFREQERTAYLVSFSLSVLAGIGVAWLNFLPVQSRKTYAALIAGALLTGIVAFFLVWKIPLRLALANHEFTIQVLLAVISIIFLALIIRSQPHRAWILVPLTVINLFYANWDVIQSPIPLAEAMSLPSSIISLKAASEDCSEAITPCQLERQELPGRVFNETHLPNGFGPTLALENIGGTSPLQLKRYANLFEDFPLDRLWQLTGVEHVLTWRAELFEPAKRLGSFQDGKDTVYLYRLADPNPRAWFVDEVKVMADEEALQAMAAYQIDPVTTALLAPTQAAKLSSISSTDVRTNTDIHLQRLAPARLQLSVPPPAGGLMILSENWMPGWRATLVRDGRGNKHSDKLTIVRADITLLGIDIPKGGGVIEVQYAPNSIRIGLAITSSTLLILVLIAIAPLAKKTNIHREDKS